MLLNEHYGIARYILPSLLLVVYAFVYHKVGYCFGYTSYMEEKFLHPSLIVISIVHIDVWCDSGKYTSSFPFSTSIKALTIAKKGLPRMSETYLFPSMLSTIKSIENLSVSTFTSTSSMMRLGYLIDLSASYGDIIVGFTP